VGAKSRNPKLVLSLAEEARRVSLSLRNWKEVLRTSHRIVVLRDREKVTEFAGEVDRA